jgi:hypothetical protein
MRWNDALSGGYWYLHSRVQPLPSMDGLLEPGHSASLRGCGRWLLSVTSGCIKRNDEGPLARFSLSQKQTDEDG